MVSRENKNNAYAKFSRANKDYYGIFKSGPLDSGLMSDNVLDVSLVLLALETKRTLN